MVEQSVERSELRREPTRLVMVKRVGRKEDGRRIIYYDFEEEPAADGGAQASAPARRP